MKQRKKPCEHVALLYNSHFSTLTLPHFYTSALLPSYININIYTGISYNKPSAISSTIQQYLAYFSFPYPHPRSSTSTLPLCFKYRYLLREAKCGDWIPLISNYTATNGDYGGTYVRVFSDGTTTAQVDAMIARDGQKLVQTKVMGHVHVGACAVNPLPTFDQNGVRPTTVGAHWMNTNKEEMHFMFETEKNGDANAMSCTSYSLDRTAVSVVLHEADTNAVVGMHAKKLCCDLTWDVKDRAPPSSTPQGSGSSELWRHGMAVSAVLVGVVAAIL